MIVHVKEIINKGEIKSGILQPAGKRETMPKLTTGQVLVKERVKVRI